MKRRILFPLVLAFVAYGCAHRGVGPGIGAPSPSSSSTPIAITSSADVVKVNTANVSITRGDSADATVTLSISPGFHINANPATFTYQIATEVTVGKIAGLVAGKPAYPVAVKKKFQFEQQPLAVYEGDAQVKIKLQTDATTGKGAQTLPVTVRVQACDNEKCYPPATLSATIALDIK
jgi:hypothetical protein